MSYGGRTILINASLSNSAIYCMSMFLLPKTTIKNLDKQRRKFYWRGGGGAEEEISFDQVVQDLQRQEERRARN
jgi:hypothetical protein